MHLIANGLSQLYVAFINIVMLPIYLRMMGAEAYGLVGFFTMLQICFSLLDLGLTPTIARESARFYSAVVKEPHFSALLHTLYRIFFCIASAGTILFLVFSKNIASNWLQAKQLSLLEIQTAIQIMAFCLAFRWMSGFYKGLFTGTEKFVWLGTYNAVIASLRFLLVIPVMQWFGATVTVFFGFQLLVAVMEFLGFFIQSNRILPKISFKQILFKKQGVPLQSLFKFSGIIACTSSIWIFVSQIDKLILSKILSLQEYAYFTIAVTAASGILMLTTPIATTLMPRLVKLESEAKYQELLQVYRQCTRIVTVLAGSAAIALAYCANPLLSLWLGDKLLAAEIAPVLSYYAIGNGFLSLAAFPYYLQYAKGNLQMHFIGHMILLVLLVPGFIISATYYGALGAAIVWAIVNALYFFVWVAISHRKLMRGLHLSWLIKDIMCLSCPAILLGGIAFKLLS